MLLVYLHNKTLKDRLLPPSTLYQRTGAKGNKEGLGG
jgi:hypothetical protein